MKSLWMIVFGLMVVVFAGVFAVAVYATLNDRNEAPPEVMARKAECKNLVAHIIGISPQRGERSVDEVLAKIPIEDIEQCAAAHPEVVACMQKAPDVAGVRSCIPQHVDCAGPETVIEGARPIFEVGGDCKKLVVRTNNAVVILPSKSGAVVQDTGSGNRIDRR